MYVLTFKGKPVRESKFGGANTVYIAGTSAKVLWGDCHRLHFIGQKIAR